MPRTLVIDQPLTFVPAEEQGHGIARFKPVLTRPTSRRRTTRTDYEDLFADRAHRCRRSRSRLAAFGANAQDNYPNRPIKHHRALHAGRVDRRRSRAPSPTRRARRSARPIIVENRGGAGTAIGTQTAQQAPADGYTLLFGSGTMISTMLALKEPGYAMEDFTPVTMLGDQFYVLLMPKALPISNAKEFVEYAKKNRLEDELRHAGRGLALARARRPLRALGRLRVAGHRLPRRHADREALMSNDVQGYFATQIVRDHLREFRQAAHAWHRRGRARRVPARRSDLQGDRLRGRRRARLVRDVRALRHAEADHRQAAEGVRRRDGLGGDEGTPEEHRPVGLQGHDRLVPENLDNEIKQKAEETKRLGIVPQ